MSLRRSRVEESDSEGSERLDHNRRVRTLSQEYDDEQAVRRENNRRAQVNRRNRETFQERQLRLESDRRAHALNRARETSQERENRLAANREVAARQPVSEVRQEQIRQAQRIFRENRAAPMNQATFRVARQGVRASIHSLGDMDRACTRCGALHFSVEKSKRGVYNSCCNFGTFHLPLFENFPDSLREFFTSDSPEANNFRLHIRNYNNSLAMATMTTTLDPNVGRGPYCFKVHGMVYHYFGSLRPAVNQAPVGAQVLIMDTDQVAAELAGRSYNSSCDPAIFSSLHSILIERNTFLASFKMMDEVCRTEERNALAENRSVSNVRMQFANHPGDDQRRYNAATSNEIAAVFVGDEEDAPPRREMTVFDRRTGGLQRMSDIDPKVDPLSYPILFPNGEMGWSPLLQRENSSRARLRVTQREYYSFYLFPRANIFSPILNASKLFQQYVVDSWMKTEQNRVHFFRTHQRELRLNTIQGLEDDIEADPLQQDGPGGRRAVLPVSHQGGPRHMVAAYQDAMTIVSRFGKPDIFLTFTCNPKAAEITDNLGPHQTASDRPDLVARVFKLKLDSLMNDIYKKHVFGHVVAHISVIEFQKRGLPHCHMLLCLASPDKFLSSSAVDEVICAELPDPFEDPELFDIVSKSMIHRPCGSANPQSPCMVKGKCSKKFPKAFCEQTNLETEGYPVYRRRQDGRETVVGRVRVDNRWVVPYSPYLSRRYNAHINVEICSNIVAVKYLYKYVYKGTDRARIALNSDDANSDELTTYLDSRYVCAPEAVHRLLGFPMQEKSHSIVRLQVHLPGFNFVIFSPGNERAALEAGRERDSSLTAWFKLNESDPEAREFLYYEIPQHYVSISGNQWRKRVRGSGTLGRMMFVSPSQQERFALRLLLLNVRGATSFEFLRTVNGVLHPTFSEAAKAAGLMLDDSHARLSLQDALALCNPAQIRALFVTLLAFSEISDPTALWNEFKDAMSEDFVFQYSNVPGFTAEMAEALAFADVSERLSCSGIVASQILDVSYDPNLLPALDELVEGINYQEHERLGEEMYSSLNVEQRTVVDAVLLSEATDPRCFFIDGPGGSGKTFVYNTLYHVFTSRRVKIQCVAWTGIAANLLPKGQTICSTFKLAIPANDRSTMTRLSAQGRMLASTDVFIWDEAPMAPRKALEAIDLLLKDLMQNDLLFGGKFMILGGDFRQILPIVERGDRSQQVGECLKRSPLWTHFRQFQLRHNMRVQGANHSEWKDYLLAVGEGRIQVTADNSIPIPSSLRCHTDLVDKVYEGIETLDIQLSEVAILTSTNLSALLLNERVLTKLPGTLHTCTSIDGVVTETPSDALNIPTEFLNQMTPSGMPPHILNLKKGAIIMLLRNLNVRDGLCNGTRLIVRDVGRRILSCAIATGSRKGEMTFIPRIDCYFDNRLPFKLRRRQFPVRLSFAMTINKAQGQSFDRIGLCLNDRIFTHGQLYVALSRARSQEGVFIESTEDNMTNVVFDEVL